MRDTLLFIHFFSLTFSAGTGIYLWAVARYASKNFDQAEAKTLMPGIANAISQIGGVGLILLILSGVGLAWLSGGLLLNTLFVAKMFLVALIVVFVTTMKRLAASVKTGKSGNAAQWMRKLGPVGPVLGGLAILTAVLAFH